MRTTAPALLPIFRSETQLEVLAALYAAPGEIALSALAERIDAPLSTVSREVARLVEAGLVSTTARGRAKYVVARRDFAWAPALAEMLDRTVGVSAILSHHLAGVEGIESALVFGSWAARRHGRLGPPPHDLDVLIVGHPSAFSVQAAAAAVEQETGLRVDVTVVTPDAWTDPGDDAVLASIRQGPLVDLDLRG